jgi:uncharacterized membrane protein (DUF2068 family)
MKVDAGVSAIIVYKLVKAVAEAVLGVIAIYLVVRGAEAGAATLAEFLLEHVTRNWALAAATIIVQGGTSGHVKFVALVAFGDAVLSAVEGLALLPWEAFELFIRPSWIRAVLLVINLAVVVYLLRGVVREHRQVRQVDGFSHRT